MRSRLPPSSFRLALLAGLSVASGPALRAQAVDTVRVLELHGTPYERGEQHGKALRAEIAELLERWDRELQREHHIGLTTFVERFLAATSYDAATLATRSSGKEEQV